MAYIVNVCGVDVRCDSPEDALRIIRELKAPVDANNVAVAPATAVSPRRVGSNAPAVGQMREASSRVLRFLEARVVDFEVGEIAAAVGVSVDDARRILKELRAACSVVMTRARGVVRYKASSTSQFREAPDEEEPIGVDADEVAPTSGALGAPEDDGVEQRIRSATGLPPRSVAPSSSRLDRSGKLSGGPVAGVDYEVVWSGRGNLPGQKEPPPGSLGSGLSPTAHPTRTTGRSTFR